ncbi:hypothetical protein FIBSPDRAFT_899820 [Athelia psychrophila]|uniref:CFEM domain-containing protein n=1 Tax=Athelia psychrophila TaxID=1759441 RepID=A0A165Z7P2_9AGAM|nr:hypothetical protein FIBSPDRAFT_899820 [Fibularhizoctonia sp. CBS 109695]
MVAFKSLTVISLGFFASQTLASAPISSALLSLTRRQTSTGDIPSACQSGCDAVTTSLENCDSASDPLACVCAASSISAVQSCVNCLIAVDPSSSALESAGANLVSTVNTECSAKGAPTLTVPGSAAATGSSAPAATASGSSSGSSSSVKNSSSANAATGIPGLVGLAALGLAAALL